MATAGACPGLLSRLELGPSPISSCCPPKATHLATIHFGVRGKGFLTNSSANVSVECRLSNHGVATRNGKRRGMVRALGGSALVAKEMERVAAKEALLLAIKDAGGLKGLLDPSANDKGNIDVNEKVLILERLNPTPRPSTSPILEGLWQFEWAGATSPSIMAVKTLLRRFPPELANVDSLTLEVLDGGAKATGSLKFLNSIESSFTLLTKLTVEGPMKVKEEYVEGLLASPKVGKGTIPSSLKGFVDQLTAALERLPAPLKDAASSGLKVPLSGSFSRELLISYLDEEVLVARDKLGVPDVLMRLEAPATDYSSPDVIVPEYVS